jgi:hypothetical protein
MKRPRVAIGRIPLTLSGALALMASLAATLPAQDYPKKYDLKLTWKAVEGYRSHFSQDESRVYRISISTNGSFLDEEDESEATAFDATELITEVTEDKATGLRWSFSKATQRRGGSEAPLRFQGRTVVVTVDTDGRRTFGYENGEALAPEDVVVLRTFQGSAAEEPGEPTGEEIFAPKNPVAVGEGWSLDFELIARSLGPNMSFGFDLKRSSAEAMLKSVTTLDGVEFGQMEVSVHLYITQFGSLKFDWPVLMNLTAHIQGCVDGKRPDAVLTMHMEAKGQTTASLSGDPRRFSVSLDMETRGAIRQQTLM